MSKYANTLSIRVSKPKITQDTVVDCSNTFPNSVDETLIYVPSEAGYYNFTATKTDNNSSSYVSVKVNDKYVGQIYGSNNSTDTERYYISPQSPLNIVLTKGGSQTASVKLTFEKIAAKQITDMSDFEIEDGSYYSLILPESGVYQITGSAYYNASSWRDAGEYSHFFSPIVKNCSYPSFNYDAQDSAIPVFFSGKRGDEILFKEVPQTYYNFEYPISASISKVSTEEIQLGSLVSSTEGCKLYHINITRDGTYKFEDFSTYFYDSSTSEYGNGLTVFGVDGDWHYFNSTSSGENSSYTYTLKAGTYYIAAMTYSNNLTSSRFPEAKFKISRVSGSDDDTLEISGTKSASGVTYTIHGDLPDNATLYAALYDGNKLKEIKTVKNPISGNTITFDNSVGSYTCKLFLWDANMTPLCGNFTCD